MAIAESAGTEQQPDDGIIRTVDGTPLKISLKRALWQRKKTALLLVAVEGNSYQETAEIMGISPGTVASRIARARATLATMMEGAS